MASVWDGLAIVAVLAVALYLYTKGYLSGVVGNPPAYAAGNGVGTPGCPAPCNCIYDNASQTCLCSGTNNCPCTGCSAPSGPSAPQPSKQKTTVTKPSVSTSSFGIEPAGERPGHITTGTPTVTGTGKCINHRNTLTGGFC